MHYRQVAKTQLYVIACDAMDNITFHFIVIQCFVLAHTILFCATKAKAVDRPVLPKEE